jgi:cell wall-associated NlpC family hydrolase
VARRPRRARPGAALAGLTAVVGLLTAAGLLAPSAAVAKPSPADLGQRLSSASQQLEVVVEQYNVARERLTATQAQRAAVNRQLVPLQQAVAATQRQVGQYSAGLYENAGGGSLLGLLASGSPESLLDQLTVLEHLATVQRRQISALTTAQQQYEAKQRSLDALIVVQNVQQADLAAKRTAIQSQIAGLQEMRLILNGGIARSTPHDKYVPAYAVGPAGVAIRFAMAQLGKAYQWGAAGPGTFDCSGLTMAAWRAAGVKLPHSSTMQWTRVAHVSRDQLQPGDLVFYYSNIHHVAMYLGDNKVVHAPTYGENVSIAPMDLAPIYGYGRP